MNRSATLALQQSQLDAIAAQGPALDVVPVVKNAVLPRPSRALRCLGQGGTIRVVMASGQQRDSKIAADQVLPWSITKLLSAGTTATELEAWL